MEISMNSLMLAIKAMQRDIDQHQALLSDDQLSDDDADYHGQYIMDLTRALGEIGDVYERSRGGHPGSARAGTIAAWRLRERLPRVFDVDLGHTLPQLTLINGAIAYFTVADGAAKVSQRFL